MVRVSPHELYTYFRVEILCTGRTDFHKTSPASMNQMDVSISYSVVERRKHDPNLI